MGITFSRAADPGQETAAEARESPINGSLHEPRIRISDTKQLPNYHVRQGSLRSKQPLPDPIEVEKQFAKLLVSLQWKMSRLFFFSYFYHEKNRAV